MKRFKIEKSGIKDTVTELIWSKEKHQKMNWSDAVKYCKELNEKGQSDWRLPSIDELQTIVDKEEYKPAVSKALHTLTPPLGNFYWSSTTDVNRASIALVMRLSSGYVDLDYKTSNCYVWPVRGIRK